MTVKRKGLAHLKELSHGFRVALEVAITILERASNVCVPNNAHIIYVLYTVHTGHHVYNSDGIFRLHSDFLLNIIII